MFPEPTELLLIGWFDRINLEPKIQIKFVDTKNQLADILTESSHEMNGITFFRLFNIMSFSMYSFSHFSDFLSDDQVRKQGAVSKRGRKITLTEGSPRDHAWWRVTRGVRKSLHKVWDLWSIRRTPMKEKKSQ